MSSIADLVVNVSANIASLQQGMDRASSLVTKFGTDISKSLDGVNEKLDGVGSAFKGIAAALGVGLSFAAFKELITSSVEAQASLADLGLKAGITAEQVSALVPAARLSNTSLETVAAGAGKFAKSLVEISAGTGQGVQVFRQLGLSAQDAARFLKDPAEGLAVVSERLSKFADDGNKVAAAQILLGKSGAQLLPFLHDLAEEGAAQAAVTNRQAAAAKVLQDEWTRTQLATENLKNTVVAAFVPAMAALTKAFRDVANEAGGTRDQINKMAKDGTLTQWAYDSGLSLAKLADEISNGPRVIAPYAQSLGLIVVAALDVQRAISGLQMYLFTLGQRGGSEISAAAKDLVDSVKTVRDSFAAAAGPAPTRYADAFKESYGKIQTAITDAAKAAESGRPSIAGLGKALDDGAAAARTAAESYDAALAKLAQAQNEAGNTVAQANIKAALDDLKRAYDGSLVDFRSYFAQRSALQIQSLQSEGSTLAANLAEQTSLQANYTQQALTLDRERFKTAGAYAAAYYELITRATNAEATAAGIKARLTAVQIQLNQVGKEYATDLVAQSDGVLKLNRVLDEMVKAQERSNEEIGLTRSAVTALNIARVEELRANTNLLELTPELQAFYDKQIDGLRRLGAAQEKGEGIQRVIDAFRELDSAAQGIFERIGEKGQDVFKQIGASIKKFVLDLIYQLTVKPILIQIAASVTGNSGITGALAGATQPGGLLGLFSQGSSLFGGAGTGGAGGGLASLFSSFATSGVGAGLGLSTTLTGSAGALYGAGAAAEVGSAAAGAAGTALTAAGTTMLAAIPVVGWAIAAAAAIYSIIQANKKPTQVEGQFGFRDVKVPGSAFEDSAFTASKFGNLGFLDQGTQQFSGEAGQVLNKSVSGLLDLFAKRFTDAQIAQTSANLQSLQFPHFEGTFTTEDFLKKYGDQILKQVATTAFDVLDPALGKVLAGFKGTGQELTTFIGSLIVFHDIVAKLPTDVAASLEASIGNTQEGLDKVATFATAFLNLQDVLNSDPLEDVAKRIKGSSLAGAFDLATTSMQELIDKFDGSAESTTALVAATQRYYEAQVQLVAQIEQVKTSINSLFSDTLRNLQLSVLDNPGQQDFLSAEITRLQQQITDSSNPDQIAQFAQLLNQDINQLFQLETSQFQQAAEAMRGLTPEQQADYVRAQQQQLLAQFAPDIEAVNALVQQRLTDVETAATNTAQGILTQVKTDLLDAIADLKASAEAHQSAADTMQGAADTMQDAVDTPITVGPIELVWPEIGETNG